MSVGAPWKIGTNPLLLDTDTTHTYDARLVPEPAVQVEGHLLRALGRERDALPSPADEASTCASNGPAVSVSMSRFIGRSVFTRNSARASPLTQKLLSSSRSYALSSRK